MKRSLLFLSGIVLIILIGNGCSDDPVSPKDDHFKAEGIVFLQSGIKIAEIFRGETNDTLFAPLGNMTSHIDVKFFNSDKVIINAPDDPDLSFAWEISDTSIVGVWQHPGEEGEFEFHLVGKIVGSTKIEFFIMHDDHADFRSGKITVTVQ